MSSVQAEQFNPEAIKQRIDHINSEAPLKMNIEPQTLNSLIDSYRSKVDNPPIIGKPNN
jgi:predicted DNA-binding protein (UPF0251 family)